MLSVEECVRLGVYDPADPNAADRWALLELLVELGATPQDLAEHRDGLPGLPSVLVLRGGPGLTLAESAAQAGVPLEQVRRLVRAAGFAEPGPADRVLPRQFPELVQGAALAGEVFGDDAVLGLIRVMGSAMARVADAMVSAFLVNVEAGVVRGAEQHELAIGRANAEAAQLMTVVAPTLDVLLRQHVISARRTYAPGADDAGEEVQQLAVGFLDVVGSTDLARDLSIAEFSLLLRDFEGAAAEHVSAASGRVVKLIGDEVLFTTRTVDAACEVSRAVMRDFDGTAARPRLRGGVAAGAVLLRDGDVFGPVVTLAARLVRLAPSGHVAVPAALEVAGAQPYGTHELKGFPEPVGVCLLG